MSADYNEKTNQIYIYMLKDNIIVKEIGGRSERGQGNIENDSQNTKKFTKQEISHGRSTAVLIAVE